MTTISKQMFNRMITSMEDFPEYIDWAYVQEYDLFNLTEEHLDRFRVYLDWHIIGICYPLTESMITRFVHYLDFNDLVDNPHVSDETITVLKMKGIL